jgi:hypothetical protein
MRVRGRTISAPINHELNGFRLLVKAMWRYSKADFRTKDYILGIAIDSMTRHSATRPPPQQANIR